jgi:hypothetical protein
MGLFALERVDTYGPKACRIISGRSMVAESLHVLLRPKKYYLGVNAYGKGWGLLYPRH